MGKYWVAIFKENTQGNQMSDTPARKDKLKKAVEDTYAYITTRRDKADDKLAASLIGPYALFVAPEYLFANPVDTNDHEVGMVRQVDEDAKVQIEEFIKGLSHQHPGMILVPGSVAWHKPFDRDYNAYLKRKKASDDAGTREKFDKKQSRRDKATAALQAYKARFPKTPGAKGGQHLDTTRLFQCPDSSCGEASDVPGVCSSGHGALEDAGEWALCRNCGCVVEEWNGSAGRMSRDRCPNSDCDTRLVLRSKTTDQVLALVPTATKMARNTVYVYLNGERKMKYQKQAGFHEVLTKRKETVFVPGKKQPTVEIDGKWYGIEVCLDHGGGALKTPQLPSHPPTVKPDFHIIVSAAIDPILENSYAKPGGWVVSASSDEDCCKLYKMGSGSWTEQTEPHPVGNVDVYEIEV
jgi:hypothetical protein